MTGFSISAEQIEAHKLKDLADRLFDEADMLGPGNEEYEDELHVRAVKLCARAKVLEGKSTEYKKQLTESNRQLSEKVGRPAERTEAAMLALVAIKDIISGPESAEIKMGGIEEIFRICRKQDFHIGGELNGRTE